MKRIFEAFFCLGMLICGDAWAGTMHVVVYGDSLTSGYELQPEQAFPAKLERKLKEIGFQDFDVTNMSQAGETTSGGIERLSSVLALRPDIVVLELGSNDALRGIAVNRIYDNLGLIIEKLVQIHAYVILIGVKAPPSMGYSYGKQLEQSYAALARFYNLSLYPFALDGVVGNPELNLADGYHPNGKGVDVMVEGIYRLVDAGMRWKYNALQQQQYQQQYLGDEPARPIAPTGAAPLPAQ